MSSPTPGAPARLGDRQLFPDLDAVAYLSHAAISPPSVPVIAASHDALTTYARLGVRAFPEFMSQRDDLKADLVELLGLEADSLGWVSNTTQGVTAVALSLPWKAGDRVLCFQGEFPANVTPWQQAAATFGLELIWHEADAFRTDLPKALERFEDALRAGVRLVAVSAVQFQTGLRMPLKVMGELCRRHGAELFVDAIQGCGVVPLELQEVDYLTCGSHKFLMGIEGCGFVSIRAEAAARLVPRVAGWLGHEEAARFLFDGPGHLRYDRPFKRSAAALESGAVNVAGLAALGASVGLLRQLGTDAIFAHVTAYLDALEGGLVARGFKSARCPDVERRSGTLSVLPPAPLTTVEVAPRLVERGVIVSTPDGWLRFAPQWPNALDEVPAVLDAVDAALTA